VRENLERQLQAHALSQSHLGELNRVILPRLTELLTNLLTYPHQIELRHHTSFIQAAVSIICAGVLARGLPGAKFHCVFRDEKLQKETQSFSEFLDIQNSKTTSNDNHIRAEARKALQQDLELWKKKWKDVNADLQQMKSGRAAEDLQKLAALKDKQKNVSAIGLLHLSDRSQAEKESQELKIKCSRLQNELTQEVSSPYQFLSISEMASSTPWL